MKRDEEIKQASIKYVESFDILSVGDKANISLSFRNGAKWADNTMLNKVITWITEQPEYVGVSFKDDFIERLKYYVLNSKI